MSFTRSSHALPPCFMNPFQRTTLYTKPFRPFQRSYSNKTPTSGGIENHDAYCRDFVKKHDRDSYLTTLFFPRELQNACFAVKAFYTELAMIQDSVSNVDIGRMRMQFWKDGVNAISSGRPLHHPIALALYDATKIANIPPYHLKRIIDARSNELSMPTHYAIDTLLAHAESTSSTINYILLSILNLSSSDALAHAASHLGVAQTFTTLLRALPYHASKCYMPIPADITAKHHVSHEEVFRRGGAATGISDAVYEFATVANDNLLTTRSLLASAAPEDMKRAMPVFLSAVPVSHFLRRLEGTNFDAFDPTLQRRENVRLPWEIWRAYSKGAV